MSWQGPRCSSAEARGSQSSLMLFLELQIDFKTIRLINCYDRKRRMQVHCCVPKITSHGTTDTTWQTIAKRKQTYRDSQIPQQWSIPSSMRPKDPPLMKYGPQNVLHISCECGILSPTEVTSTETYSVQSLLSALASQNSSALNVTTAFCKRTAIAQQITNCVTEPLFSSALQRAKNSMRV